MKKTIPPATERIIIKNLVSIDNFDIAEVFKPSGTPPLTNCSVLVIHPFVQEQNLDNPSNSSPLYSCRLFSNFIFKIGSQLLGLIKDSV